MKRACHSITFLKKSTDGQFYFLLFMIHDMFKCTHNTVVTGYKYFTAETAEEISSSQGWNIHVSFYVISYLNEIYDWANILNVRMNIRSCFV
jgi:hypothetical protein